MSIELNGPLVSKEWDGLISGVDRSDLVGTMNLDFFSGGATRRSSQCLGPTLISWEGCVLRRGLGWSVEWRIQIEVGCPR